MATTADESTPLVPRGDGYIASSSADPADIIYYYDNEFPPQSQPRQQPQRRVALFRFLEGASPSGARYEQFTIFLIFLSVVTSVLSTVFLPEFNTTSEWADKCDSWCDAIWFGNRRDNVLSQLLGIGSTSVVEIFVVGAFTVDYILRVFTADMIDPAKYGGVLGRLRFVFTFFALVDLFSIAPLYVDAFLLPNTELGASTFLRMFRLLRMKHTHPASNGIFTNVFEASSLTERRVYDSDSVAGDTFGATTFLVDGFDRAQRQPQTREGGVTGVHYQRTMTPESRSTVLHAVTAMLQYEQKSFEELRLEDYMSGNRGLKGNAASAPLPGIGAFEDVRAPPQRESPSNTGTALVPYQKTIVHAITAMPYYEQKSFEELRLEDYMSGNRGSKGNAASAPLPVIGAFEDVRAPPQKESPSTTGTALVPYQRTTTEDGTSWVIVHAITAMPHYEQKSFEELRLEDYGRTAAAPPCIGDLGSGQERHDVDTASESAPIDITDASQNSVNTSEVYVGYQEPDVYCEYPADDETLQLISTNDRSVAGLSVLDNFWAGRAEQLGNALAKNSRLRSLLICNQNLDMSSFALKTLFQSLSLNRSIEHLILDGFDLSEVIPILAHFFERNQNIRCLHLTRPTHFTPFSSLFLCRQNQLERIVLEGIGIQDGHAASLIHAIQFNSGLRHFEVCWRDDHIGQKGCAAFGKLLMDPHSKLRCLDLSSNNLDDECIGIIASALIKNRTLKELILADQKRVTPSCWRFFSSILSNHCSLQKLNLSGNNIGDDGAISFGTSLAATDSNETSKRNGIHLDLSHTDPISLIGWQGFSSCLSAPKSALVGLNISCCSIDDAAAAVVVPASLRSSSLRSLTMIGMVGITANGWYQCFQVLRDSDISVSELELSGNNIDDMGAAVLFDLLRNASLNILDMAENASITAAGWATCFQSLLDSDATVKVLGLRSNSIDDDAAAVLSWSLPKLNTTQLDLADNHFISSNGWITLANFLLSGSVIKLKALWVGGFGNEEGGSFDDTIVASLADALVHNTSLTFLGICSIAISSQGWSELANAFCNNSSIDSICNSNHTLLECRPFQDEDFRRSRFSSLLGMNKNDDKAAVIRKKIITNYFSDLDNIGRVFVRAPAVAMPNAIAWIGQDRLGFTTMYHLLRNFPSLLSKGTCL